jgi:hypothetical protein
MAKKMNWWRVEKETKDSHAILQGHACPAYPIDLTLLYSHLEKAHPALLAGAVKKLQVSAPLKLTKPPIPLGYPNRNPRGFRAEYDAARAPVNRSPKPTIADLKRRIADLERQIAGLVPCPRKCGAHLNPRNLDRHLRNVHGVTAAVLPLR